MKYTLLFFFTVCFTAEVAWSQNETFGSLASAKPEKSFQKTVGEKRVDLKSEKSEGFNKSLVKQVPSKEIFKSETKIKDLDKDKLKSVGGWGSSGGGGGVACFQDEGAAKAADGFIDRGIQLSEALKRKIVSVVTLDFWEWQNKKTEEKFYLIDARPHEDFRQILERIKENMSFMAPIFIYRLNQISPAVDPGQWIQKDAVARIYDSEPKRSLPKNCRLVQLVARYTNQDHYQTGQALDDGKKPLVKIEADQYLLSRLDEFNKAILVLHEELYLLGQIIGYSSSDNVRPIVMKFFSKILEAKLINTPLDYGLRGQLVSLFGDYIMYFGDELPPAGKLGSQESRFNSFYRMTKTIRSKIESCYTQQGVTKDFASKENVLIINACKDKFMHPAQNETWMDDEMSFIFISYYFISISLKKSNGELILAPLKSKDFQKASEGNVAKSCQWIASNQLVFQIMQQKALRYCQMIEFNQAPRETDQN